MWIRTIGLLLFFLCPWSLAQDVVSMRFALGDDPRWSAPDFDDSSWQTVSPGPDSGDQRRWWARVRVEVTEPTAEPFAVEVFTLGAYEVFWNSELIDHNGRPGSSAADEVPGHQYKLILFPDQVQPGVHILALRLSTWQARLPSKYFRVYVGNVSEVLRDNQLRTGLYLGIFLLLLVAGTLFLAYRHPSQPAIQRFGLLCLAVAGLLLLEHGKFLILYPYNLHIYRLIIISTLTTCVALLLPWFLRAHLDLQGSRYWLADGSTLLPLLLFIGEPDLHCYLMLGYSLGHGLVLCLLARFRHGEWLPAETVAVGATFGLISFTGDRFADRWFFPAFLLMVGILAVRLLIESRVRREALIAEQLASQRLKVELLRKSIQPHFLKNTLAAAMSWFEENPDKGVGLLGSLAEELDHFFKIGNRDLVPMTEELALCAQHLETMAYVMDCPLNLEIDRGDVEVALPPGLLITCVENALTHGCFDEQGGTVKIRAQKTGSRLSLWVNNPAEQKDHPREGTGTTYLRTLLKLHYGDQWSLTRGWSEGFWEIKLVIDSVSNQQIS